MAGCFCSALSTEEEDFSEDLERICPASSCGDGLLPNLGLTYLYRKSSFKLKFQFLKDMQVISPRDLDIIITFAVQDNESDFTLEVSHIQGNLINCSIDDDENTLTAIIGSPNFPEGILIMNYTIITQDDDFVNGTSSAQYSETSKIALVDDLSKVTKLKSTQLVAREINLDIIQTLI